ncbi:lysin B [Mycobacterium phage SweetiePie]|uniref:lysin B n=1 Tax=Mycobacterium phage SweetiePie TaxID=1555235 RepID=UPI00051AA290|nr:lysin B [Mycobacterium phage SweetiePie]AIT13485.1 lysin B [Mycobacterium phage SweetiePie]
MILKKGSNGALVRLWTNVMLSRFKSYALGVDGKPLVNDGYFGNDEEKVQKEYQIRTGQFPSGEVSEDDLIRLRIVPVLFTVHGTGQADPLGPGYPADLARACLDLVHWQPIGNYPAQPFPMWPSILKGVKELKFQIEEYERRYPGYRKALAGYSQGAVVTALYYMLYVFPENGEHHYMLKRGDFLISITWGPPMREKGVANGNKFAGWHISDGRGILKGRMVNTPDWWLDFVHCMGSPEGQDLYGDVPDDKTGENETAICDFVMSEKWYSGPLSILKRLLATGANLFTEGDDIVKAVLQAGMFFGHGLTPHNIYDIGPAITALRKAVTRT